MTGADVNDGHTRIANELLEAIIRHGFSKRELHIVLAVIRKTYGYQKKSDDMTLTQLASLTGIKLPHISATVRDLGEKNVLLIRSGKYGKVIGLSKDYRRWKSQTKAPEVTETVSDQNGNVTETVTQGYQNGNLGLPKQSPQKKLPKETTKRGKRTRFPDDLTLTPEMRAMFASIAPGFDPAPEFEHFRDHHKAHNSTMADWEAAWRTWARNTVKFSGGRNGKHPNSSGPLSAVDRVRQAAAARAAEGDY